MKEKHSWHLTFYLKDWCEGTTAHQQQAVWAAANDLGSSLWEQRNKNHENQTCHCCYTYYCWSTSCHGNDLYYGQNWSCVAAEQDEQRVVEVDLQPRMEEKSYVETHEEEDGCEGPRMTASLPLSWD